MNAEEALSKPLCTLAFCWRLERRDGVTIGLTSHDRDLTVGNVRYRAAAGMVPSAVRSGVLADGDDADVEGALTSDAISASDLAAGRWDGAAVELRLTEWEEPGALWLPLMQGEMGAVSRKASRFSAELVSMAAILGAPVAPSTSPDCRASLGDRQCRVDMSRHQKTVTVSEVDGIEVKISGLQHSIYAFGSLRWLTGENAGMVQAISANDVEGITLMEPPRFQINGPVLAMLTEGCDRQLSTCSGRFANVINFRGELHLPGMDLLTRYPGA